MEFSFSIHEDDYLEHQLFVVSRSVRLQKRRKRLWIISPILLVLLGVLAYSKGQTVAYFYVIAAFIWAVGYPYFFSWSYKRHFSKHIKDYYSQKTGKPINVLFKENTLFSNDGSTEAKVDFKEFAEINELKNHIFLVTKSGDSLIFPKRIDNFDLLLNELKTVKEKGNLNWNQYLDWKWQ